MTSSIGISDFSRAQQPCFQDPVSSSRKARERKRWDPGTKMLEWENGRLKCACSYYRYVIRRKHFFFLDGLLDLVTASKDQSVGVYKLGPPSHGVTEYGEIR